MRFFDDERGQYRNGDIAERVSKKDRKTFLEIQPFDSTAVSKRAFTLLELMLVIALITIGVGTLAVQLPKLLKGEQFEQNCDLLISKLMLAQEWIIDKESDMKVAIIKKDGNFQVELHPSQKVTEREKRCLNRNRVLKGIEKIAFNGKEYATLDLLFNSSLGSTPKGILQISGDKKSTSFILRGFPSPIKRGKLLNAEEKAIYPEEILHPF